jgi:outer membrane protein
MTRIKSLVPALLMSISLQAVATEDLLSIYSKALTEDRILAAARALDDANQQLKNQGIAALLPDVLLQGYTTQNDRRDRINHTSEDYNSHGYTLSLQQPVFNLAAWFGFKQALSITRQSSLALAAEEQSLILRVAQAYFNVLRAEDNLSTALAQERALAKQKEQAQVRFEVGLIARTDALEAEAAYDDATVVRIDSETSLDLAWEELSVITGMPRTDLERLSERFPVTAPTPSNGLAWYNFAMSNNLALAAAKEAVVEAHQNLRVNQSRMAPNVDIVGAFDRSISNRGIERNPGPDQDRQDFRTSSIGLELNMPIFTGGDNLSRARRARSQLMTAEYQRDQTMREVKRDSLSLYRTVDSDISRIRARRQGIQSSRLALEATQAGYEVGTRTIVDVLDSQRQLFAAINDYDNARYDYIINSLSLKQVAGTLSPEDLVALNQWLEASRRSTVESLSSGD